MDTNTEEKTADLLTPEEVLAGAEQARKDRWLSIFIQLSRCRRFNGFVKDNYTITDAIDPDLKVIDTQVIEKPIAVGPKLSPVQLMQFSNLLATHGCRDIPAAMDAVMKFLGHESSSIITAPNDFRNLKGKLDA